MEKSDDNRSYIVRGSWNPSARHFRDLTLLNEETPKGSFDEQSKIFLFFENFILFLGTCIFLTVALDLVISGIHEPVRFSIEAKARISESNDASTQDLGETIWSSFKKVTPFTEEFDMIVQQVIE